MEKMCLSRVLVVCTSRGPKMRYCSAFVNYSLVAVMPGQKCACRMHSRFSISRACKTSVHINITVTDGGSVLSAECLGPIYLCYTTQQ